jgi:hypothetical protein
MRMSEIARELCELAAAGRTSGALKLHDQLAEALAQTSAAFRGHIGRAGASS